MNWPDDVDPGSLRQPDGYSCGAAVVVAVRVLHDPEYRPDDPAETIREVHRQLVAVSHAGRLQVPWPRALGTPPWAIAREIERLTGLTANTHLTRWRPEPSYAVLAERVAERPVGVYLGNRWLPRHVVLAIGATDDGVQVFDPAAARLTTVPRERWTTHRVGVAGWGHFWAVV